jgi:ketosteroid isomerase-like protein
MKLHRAIKIQYVLVLSVCLFSCSKKNNSEEVKQALLNADVEFSKYSESQGQIKAFIQYADENATLMRPNSMPVISKKEIEKLYSTKSDTSYVLTWKPLFAEVAESADLGYTYGTWLLIAKNEEQKGINSEGTYSTVWKKQNDGSWKWLLDSGNDGLKNPEISESQQE